MKKTNWKTYENVIKEELKNIKLNQHCPTEAHKLLKNTILKIAITTTGKYQMANNIRDQPQIRQKRKREHKYEYKNRKIALNNYLNSQMELKRTTEQHITENIEKRLKTIAQQGLNSKPFWNIVRQMKRNNSEDLIAIKDGKGSRMFSEEEINLHKVNYYKNYTKKESVQITTNSGQK